MLLCLLAIAQKYKLLILPTELYEDEILDEILAFLTSLNGEHLYFFKIIIPDLRKYN